MTISILGCGWFGLALGKKLAVMPDIITQGSTTTPAKLPAIEDSGIRPFVVELWAHCPSNFFCCDVLVIALPPSVPKFEGKIARVIELIREHNINKVVFISTSSVYPNLNREVTEADAEYIRSSHSGVTMLAIEDHFRNQSSFQSTIIRFAGLYGPGRVPGRFLAGKSGLKGATSPVNLIHQEDCVEITAQIILKGIWGETFNACSDEHPDRKEFYEKAALAAGLKPPKFSDEPAAYKIVNSEKLKSALGYRFIHSDPIKDL